MTKSNGFKKAKKKVMLGFAPHVGQKKLLNVLMNAYTNRFPRHQVFDIGRQWGKSLMICNLFLWIAINNPNQQLAYIGPYYKLARKIFREFINAVEGAPCLAVENPINKTELEVHFRNKSYVKFGSAENPNAWRGYTFDTVCIDEAAFCDESIWKVIEPTLRIKKGLAIFISTPNGQNWFWNMYMRQFSGLKDWQSHTAPSWESPYINKAEIDEVKKHSLTQWRIEYNAEFIEDDTTVFRNVSECVYGPLQNQPKLGEKVYFGLDLGRKQDFSVGIIVDESHRVRDIMRINKRGWDLILPEIAKFWHKWKPVFGYGESNYNDRILEELKKDHGCKNLVPLYTSTKTKPEMVDNLAILFDEKIIKLPEPVEGEHTMILHSELKQYTYRYNPKTHRMSHGAPGDLHDDCCMALMIAEMALKQKNPKRKPMILERL